MALVSTLAIFFFGLSFRHWWYCNIDSFINLALVNSGIKLSQCPHPWISWTQQHFSSMPASSSRYLSLCLTHPPIPHSALTFLSFINRRLFRERPRYTPSVLFLFVFVFFRVAMFVSPTHWLSCYSEQMQASTNENTVVAVTGKTNGKRNLIFLGNSGRNKLCRWSLVTSARDKLRLRPLVFRPTWLVKWRAAACGKHRHVVSPSWLLAR